MGGGASTSAKNADSATASSTAAASSSAPAPPPKPVVPTVPYEAVLDNTFFGPLVPEAEWESFCALWKREPDDRALVLSNRLCFVVNCGTVHAHKAPVGGKGVVARPFRGGDVIHLFSNHDKVAKGDDGADSTMVFDGIRLSFVPERGTTAVFGLDAAEYTAWVKERPTLVSLQRFLSLKLLTLLTDNVYFMDVPPARIDMFGPLLSLKIARTNDVLFKRGTNATSAEAGTGMGLVLSGACVALYDDVELGLCRGRIASHYNIPLVAVDQARPPANAGTKEKKSVYAAENDVGLAGAMAAAREGRRESFTRRVSNALLVPATEEAVAAAPRRRSSSAPEVGEFNVEVGADVECSVFVYMRSFTLSISLSSLVGRTGETRCDEGPCSASSKWPCRGRKA